MTNPVKWAIHKIRKINDAIWHTPLSELSRRKSFLFRQLRIIWLASRGFITDKVQIRASALTFYSLMSVIPVIAIAFAIAKGFGFDQRLEQQITQSFQQNEEVLKWVLNFSRHALDATNGGYIAGIGIIILFWSVMSLLNQIENSFNHIWQIRVSRAWYRKFTDYLTIMLIAPILIILSGSVTVFVNTQLSEFMDKAPILDFFKPLVSFLVKILPYLIIWIVLTVLFVIMPNTKVRFGSAMVAGIVSGTILQLLQWFYLDLQYGISKLSVIYGSFAAIPLFIMVMQMSWIIVLLGAEISFANQNVSRYEFESEALNISIREKKAMTLMIMHLIVKNFAKGEPPLTAEMISVELKIPIRLVSDIVQDLAMVGLISMVLKDDGKERMFQPAMDIHTLTVSSVLMRLENRGLEQHGVLRSKEFEKVHEILLKFDKLLTKSDSNILIMNI
jgi:membrane protein